jgi:hypothetical protein
MKAIIDYLDKEMLQIMKNFLNEERLGKQYPIKFKKTKNGIRFTGFNKLKIIK